MKISFKPTEKSPRVTAEKKLAQEFMSILQGHHREIRGHQDTGASERRILSRTSYQNWGLGLTLGALTFGTLTGLTLRQARVAARFAVQRRPAAARYRDLDAAGPRHTESTQVATSNNTDDVWITAQMLIYGATSLVVTVASSWYFASREDFYRSVGSLPLLPGKSSLCQAACPDLIQHYRNVPNKDELRHPVTVELDAVWQLVLNCQQRTQFLRDTKENQLATDKNGTVPEPGVPFNYLGVPANWGESGQAADADENEYDWLQKLVADR